MTNRLALSAILLIAAPGGLICLTPMVHANEIQELRQAFRLAAEEAGSVGRRLHARQGPFVLPSGNKSLGIIYPGEGIGRITIGTRMKDVPDALGWGKPDGFWKDEAKNEFILVYGHNRGVEFIFSKQPQKELGESLLKTIVIRNPSFLVFGSGLGVGRRLPHRSGGDQCESAERAAGKLAVACQGIGFIADRQTGIVEAIEVFRP